MDFNDFWTIVENHGRVARFYRNECEDLWRTLTPEQQQAVYDAVKMKIGTGRFVSFRPNDAIRDNLPKSPKVQIISADEYYRRFGTQTNMYGWVRTFIPEQQKTIYVKQCIS